MTDLAMAVVVGVIVSSLVFAWQTASQIYVEVKSESKTEKTYVLHGQLFFASIEGFKDLFHPKKDPNNVTIDFKYSRVWDHSALEAIDALAERYMRRGTELHLVGLSKDCKTFITQSG